MKGRKKELRLVHEDLQHITKNWLVDAPTELMATTDKEDFDEHENAGNPQGATN